MRVSYGRTDLGFIDLLTNILVGVGAATGAGSSVASVQSSKKLGERGLALQKQLQREQLRASERQAGLSRRAESRAAILQATAATGAQATLAQSKRTVLLLSLGVGGIVLVALLGSRKR
jgi:hypothetical protein